jgi:alpha/beta hydrolase fold
MARRGAGTPGSAAAVADLAASSDWVAGLSPGCSRLPPSGGEQLLGDCPMPFTQGKDVRLYYERTGQGPRLLFVNGSGVTVDDSRLLLSLLASHFDFVAYDYRGLGKSSEPPGPYGMAECAGDALSVLDAAGWEAACVLGISFLSRDGAR